jgi:hypothetical protein
MNEKEKALQRQKQKEQNLKAEAEKAEKLRALREADAFKRRYFEFYDDVKISHKEDW